MVPRVFLVNAFDANPSTNVWPIAPMASFIDNDFPANAMGRSPTGQAHPSQYGPSGAMSG